MILIFTLLISFKLFADIGEQISKLDPNKFTVCAITIGSSEEREVFRKNIQKYPNAFNPIIELTEFNGQDWFEKACLSKVKCDQLVISGHFGGMFFGSSNKTLSTRTLESTSCAQNCDGILSKPLEVFLFGCNTLAGKEKDHRTPERHYQVLIEDNIPEREARMIVESRYGNVGSDFKSTMQRSFGGEKKQLYGFDSVGPSGKNVKQFLENYFVKKNPKEHLENLQTKRLLDTLDMTNKELAQSLNLTAFSQCSAGDKNDEITQIKCKIVDKSLSIDQRINAISIAMMHENYLLFIPDINKFFMEHPESSLTQAQRDELKLLTNNKKVKSKIEYLIDNARDLFMLAEWSEFAQNIGLETKTSKLNEVISDLFARGVSITDKDIVCSMNSNIKKIFN